MKTTTLYKCHGAWSPLWQLSEDDKFEIVSLDFWVNFNCVMMPPVPQCILSSIHDLDSLYAVSTPDGGFVSELLPYQKAIAGFLSGEAYAAGDADNKLKPFDDLIQDESKHRRFLMIKERADEIFSGDNHAVKKEFIGWLALHGNTIMVNRHNPMQPEISILT